MRQVLATGIPTAESLKLRSAAEDASGSTRLPPTLNQESKLQRDEWMMLPTSVPSVPREGASTSRAQVMLAETSLTEEYGETSGDSRTMSGGVDFFSSLGTERKKEPRADKPNPDKVRATSSSMGH